LVVRKNDDREEHFRLVGECYLHDTMKGDAFVFDDNKLMEFFPCWFLSIENERNVFRARTPHTFGGL
jgi:hypothetical protein